MAPSTVAVKVVRPFAYYGGEFERGLFSWRAGEVLTDPAEIAHLRARGAELEPIDGADPPA